MDLLMSLKQLVKKRAGHTNISRGVLPDNTEIMKGIGLQLFSHVDPSKSHQCSPRLFSVYLGGVRERCCRGE